jgi:hypothetical protein
MILKYKKMQGKKKPFAQKMWKTKNKTKRNKTLWSAWKSTFFVEERKTEERCSEKNTLQTKMRAW